VQFQPSEAASPGACVAYDHAMHIDFMLYVYIGLRTGRWNSSLPTQIRHALAGWLAAAPRLARHKKALAGSLAAVHVHVHVQS
jgi:hypothetical protein